MKLIGLNEVKDVVSGICAKAENYRRGGVIPPHMIIMLGPGNGQSTVTDYITDEFLENKVRDFHSLSYSLEYRPDGTYAQAREVIENIYANADYTNEFEGIVAVDISAFSSCLNEAHTADFFEALGAVGKKATVVAFIDPGVKRAGALREKAEEALENSVTVIPSPYTYDDYRDIVVEKIKDKGVRIKDGRKIVDLIDLCIYVIHDIYTAKDAAETADKLVLHADFSGRIPEMGLKELESFATACREAMEEEGSSHGKGA